MLHRLIHSFMTNFSAEHHLLISIIFTPADPYPLEPLRVRISTILMIQPAFIGLLVLRCGHTRLLACKIAFDLTKNIGDSQFVTFASPIGQTYFCFSQRELFASNLVSALEISGFSFSFEN